MKPVMHVCTDSIFHKDRKNHFRTVGEALLTAEARNYDEIELRLKKGRYNQNIKVNRPLTIIGEKSKQNEVVLSGSILNSDGQDLIIKNITIDNAREYAIRQNGGNLNLRNVIISGVSPTIKNREILIQRACIEIYDGALLNAKNITMIRNNLAALRVYGENTKVVISGAQISDNSILQTFIQNPPLMCGAVEVGNKGKLLIENSIIENNEYIGICVFDNAKMHLANTTVRTTKQVQDTAGNSLLGHNIVIASGAIVELRRFVSSYAESCGIFVQDAYLTAENGSVNNNTIGISFLSIPENDPSYNPYNCVYDNVQFENNITKIGNLEIPLLSFSEPDRSLCKRVPWD